MPADAEPALPLADTGKGDGADGPDRFDRIWALRPWRILAVVPLAVLVFLAWRGLAPVAVAPVDVGADGVAALGRLMPAGDVITLAPPYGTGDARIARLLVAEGAPVAAGQVLAELDNLPQLQAAYAIAVANADAAAAGLVQIRASVTAALAEATAARDAAQSAATLAGDEARRLRDLAARGVVSQQALDRAAATADQAARDLDRARAQVIRQSGGDAQPDIALAARQLAVAQADLLRAETDLARGRVLAPQAGAVLKFHVRAGEKPGAAGIASFGDTAAMQAELEVYQTDIARVQTGQGVRLTSPALAEPLVGQVLAKGHMVDRQGVLSSDPAANTDARIVRVVVALDAASSRRAADLTGLEVTGVIAP